MSYFLLQKDLHREEVPHGVNEWANYPSVAADLPGLFAARATIRPGMGHDFHLHPGREEVIHVLKGQIEQWVEKESCILSPGDTVFIPAGMVHASFNTGKEKAVVFVVLTPALSDQPLTTDVATQAPWNRIRLSS